MDSAPPTAGNRCSILDTGYSIRVTKDEGRRKMNDKGRKTDGDARYWMLDARCWIFDDRGSRLVGDWIRQKVWLVDGRLVWSFYGVLWVSDVWVYLNFSYETGNNDSELLKDRSDNPVFLVYKQEQLYPEYS